MNSPINEKRKTNEEILCKTRVLTIVKNAYKMSCVPQKKTKTNKKKTENVVEGQEWNKQFY